MDEKPALTAFSQYKLGGIQSYFYNILSNDPYGLFDKKWIFYDDKNDNATRLPDLYHCCNEVIFSIDEGSGETIYQMSARLDKILPNRPGVILSSFHYELSTLHIHRRNKQTVFFICHDKIYLNNAKRFEFLIDVFIAHNIEFYHEMKRLFPHRENDVYFMPYGVPIRRRYRMVNPVSPLKLVVLSRMDKEKGVWDIPVIEEKINKKRISVQWTIIGNGPEKESLEKALGQRSNIRFFSPRDNDAVMDLVVGNDVFVLPSRLDGLPVALLETMSAGCVPVISEFNSGIKTVVTPAEGYVLPVGDTDSFADTIELLHTNRGLLERQSMACRIKIEQEYDVKKRVKEYYDLFAQYKALKKPVRLKFHRYAGWLDYPFVPSGIKKIVNGLRSAIKIK